MLSHGVIVGPLHQPPLAAYKLEDSLQWVHSFRHHMYHLTSFKLTCSGIFSNNFRTTWELHFFDLPTPISLHFQFLLLLLTCSILLSFCLYCNLWQTSDWLQPPSTLVNPWTQLSSSSAPSPTRSYKLPGKITYHVEGFQWKFMTTSPTAWALNTPSWFCYILQNVSYFSTLLEILTPPPLCFPLS